MEAVYGEIAALNITGGGSDFCLNTLTGNFGIGKRHAVLRAGYQELTILNENISAKNVILILKCHPI